MSGEKYTPRPTPENTPDKKEIKTSSPPPPNDPYQKSRERIEKALNLNNNDK